jgi:hypothetical protein
MVGVDLVVERLHLDVARRPYIAIASVRVAFVSSVTDAAP